MTQEATTQEARPCRRALGHGAPHLQGRDGEDRQAHVEQRRGSSLRERAERLVRGW